MDYLHWSEQLCLICFRTDIIDILILKIFYAWPTHLSLDEKINSLHTNGFEICECLGQIFGDRVFDSK